MSYFCLFCGYSTYNIVERDLVFALRVLKFLSLLYLHLQRSRCFFLLLSMACVAVRCGAQVFCLPVDLHGKFSRFLRY